MELITFDGVMPVRCAGCAFTEGTEANTDPLTTVTRELCAMGRIPFYCHANAVDDMLPADTKRICHGFAALVLLEEADGYRPPAWKHAVAEEGLRLMEEAEARAKRGEAEPDDQMQTLLDRVTARLDGVV